MRNAARHTGRQLRIQQPRHDLSQLPQPLEIFLRDLQHAEPDALVLRIAA